MRREARREAQTSAKDLKNNIITLSVAIIITIMLAIVIYVVYSSSSSDTENMQIDTDDYALLEKNENEEELESASTQMGKSVEEVENQEVENQVSEETNNQNTTNAGDTVKTISATETTVDKSANSSNVNSNETQEKSNEVNDAETNKEEIEAKEELTFQKPVNGEIIREFAKDSLVYSDTLKEWVIHNGIDIKAEKTTVVTASAKGKVSAIKNDPRYGLTVIIDHQDGYQTVYSNLLTAEFVVECEEVEAGQTIGTIGNTASFEILDDYHLHFEILKDGEYIDPCVCINF